MEAWQKAHIEKNLAGLIDVTNCTTSLLVGLKSVGILTPEEIQIILSFPTQSRKAYHLYDIVQSKVGGYKHLMQALEAARLTGAVRILQQRTGNTNLVASELITYDRNTSLGRGRFAKVYKGTYKHEEAAVKRIYCEDRDQGEVLSELKILKLLQRHSNIVKYHDHKWEGDFVLIAIELCSYSAQDCVNDKKFPIDKVELLRQTTLGLEFLHKNGIIHGDLKPANILLLGNANPYAVVKLTDFGLSKLMDEKQQCATVTTFNIAGTQGWMPPEILKVLNVEPGFEQVLKMTPSTDIFGLGCVFYYVLSGGDHPFGQPIYRNSNIVAGKSIFSSKDNDANRSLMLVKRMIHQNIKERPFCSIILSDTFFNPPELSSVVKRIGSLLLEGDAEQGLTIWQKFYLYLMNKDLHMNTKLSELLIDKLVHYDVLTERQAAFCKYGEKDKVANLYSLNYRNPNTYKILMSVLYETSQIHPFQILQKGISFSGEDVFLRISHSIATKQSTDTIRNLIFKCNPETILACRGQRGESLLHVAVGCGNVDMIKILKEIGYSFTCRDVYGNTHVHYLGKWSSSNLRDVTDVLLDLDTDLNTRNFWNQTVAHVLPRFGVTASAVHEWVQYLITVKKQSLLATLDSRNFTFLHHIMMSVDLWENTFDLLKRCNLRPNGMDNVVDRVPLHYAIFRGRSKANFDGLIKCGAFWKIKDRGGRTVLHFAVWGGNVEAIEYFVNLGADVNARDELDRTPLHYLRYAPINHIEVTMLMLQSGADIYAVDTYGDTPAHDYEETWKKKQQIFERWAHFLVEHGHRKLLHGLKNKDGHVPLSLSWIKQ